jgi:nucleotide-binding universal stress UspA family protein
MHAHSILCPIDFSPTAERALELASSLAKDSGAVLIILHVMRCPRVYEGDLTGETVRATADLMETFNQVQPTKAGVPCVRSMQWGDPEYVILQTACDQKVDMIVMGTHGRTGLRRLLMGSVAEQVVRRAPCPVLTVRQPAELELLEVA